MSREYSEGREQVKYPYYEFVEVYVSAVASPGTFWVQIISSMALQLDEMTGEMSREYSEGREQVKYSLL